MNYGRTVCVCVLLMFNCFVCTNVYAEEDVMDDPLYDIELTTIDGDQITLGKYRGLVLLIVNTASRCGFTGQYAGLQELHERFYDQGFRVLGFPSNDFLGQEPGTDAEIKNFCTTRFDVTFELFSKIKVRGTDQHPLYRRLTQDPEFKGKISWNFNKFLIDRSGNVIARFGSRDRPLSDTVIAAVTASLQAE
jgi:glutathione peroxidase-family protein